MLPDHLSVMKIQSIAVLIKYIRWISHKMCPAAYLEDRTPNDDGKSIAKEKNTQNG